MALLMQSPRPPRHPRPTPGKMSLFVVNPVSQNWCQDGREEEKALGLVPSRVGGPHSHKNRSTQQDHCNLPHGQPNGNKLHYHGYGVREKNTGASGENWNLPNEQFQENTNNSDFAVSKKYGPSRTVILLIALSWLVSITALLLTVMVIFGKIGSPCGCSETQGISKKEMLLLLSLFTVFLINFLGMKLNCDFQFLFLGFVLFFLAK